MTIKLLASLLTIAIVVPACDDTASSPIPPAPTAPTLAAPAPTPADTAYYTLSGVVFEVTEAGRQPVEGVEVWCDSCDSWVYTDTDGFYNLAWATNGVQTLIVTKAGYAIFDPSGTLRDHLGRIKVTVHGDTQFDIQLARK